MEIKSKNYYPGTLDDFKTNFLPSLSPADRLKLKKVSTLIGTSTDDLVSTGYLYAHGVYYKLGDLHSPFDPSEYTILTRDMYGAPGLPDDGLVTKGYLEKHTSFETI